MAFGVFGRRKAGTLLRSVVLASAKILYNMSLAAALRSKNAEDFNTPIGEANWKSKLTFCDLVSTAIERSQEPISPGLFEPYLNGLVACVVVERTQLSNAACRLCGILPKAMGAQIHQHLDRLLPAIIRQSANTKTVAQKAASAAMMEMILNTPYNHRFLYHICQTFDDKYSAPKLYAPLWLKAILDNYPLALHPDRDYETISRAISLGLEEADNNVRVNTRACFWSYHKINTSGAEEVMNKLNAHAKTALINDPNNPDKAKSKGKKAEQDSALAQLKKERLKQKAAERRRMVSSTTVDSEDFPTGAAELADDKLSRYPPKSAPVITPTPEIQSTVGKIASRPIAIHKKGSSHDGQVQTVTKKSSAIDIGPVSKKTGSTESLRSSQNKKPTTAIETSSSRPLLSAPVRRPRIVATPINTQQPSSRPSSRIGSSHSTGPITDPVLRSAVSHKELKSTPLEPKSSEARDVSSKQSKKPAVIIPDGKENNFMTDYMNQAIAKRNDPNSPTRLVPSPERNSGRISPPKQIALKPDGLTKAQRLQHQEWDREMKEMAPIVPILATTMHVQENEHKNTQMYRAYPGLNANGNIEQARCAFDKALEYLNKDALDYMGFRKLRKLLEQFGRDLIIDRALYDLLWSHLLPRIGTYDELLGQSAIETGGEGHPRYIRQAVVTMVNILIHQYPFEWSYEYTGPALASLMMARCAYSANAEFHDGAPYINNMTIVNQINLCITTIIDSCVNPVAVLDSVLEILAACEDFLMRNAPHDSEHQTQRSWASFNPYSRLNRLRTETSGLLHPQPTNLDAFELEEPKPLPIKLPLLMETGLRIIRSLLNKAAHYKEKLGEEREDTLADLAKHLMSSYNIIIRKQVMEYCQVLYKNFESEPRFWSHFQSDSERNLLHYYLEKVR